MSLHCAHLALIIQQPGRQANVVEFLSDKKQMTVVPAFDVATLEYLNPLGPLFPERRELA